MPIRRLESRLSRLVRLDPQDIAAFQALPSHFARFGRGETLIEEAHSASSIMFIRTGWVACFKLLPSGNRQIVNFQIPGDLVGLRDLLHPIATHSVVALTAVEADILSCRTVLKIIDERPRLGLALLWALGQEESSIVDNVMRLGRHDGRGRMAQLLVDLWERLKAANLCDGAGFDMPLTQAMLGDALGISSVHVNRVLRKLREAKIVRVNGQSVEILDTHALLALAGHDPDASRSDQIVEAAGSD